MKLEAFKEYRTKAGRKVIIYEITPKFAHGVLVPESEYGDRELQNWYLDGTCPYFATNQGMDIIGEWEGSLFILKPEK